MKTRFPEEVDVDTLIEFHVAIERIFGIVIEDADVVYKLLDILYKEINE